MFDPSQIHEYRATKAPDALQARVLQATADKPRAVIHRIGPWVAAVAACLVLTVVGFAMHRAPAVSITASPAAAVARFSAEEAHPVVELTLRAEGAITLAATDAVLTLPSGEAPALPHTAQNALTLLWEITSPDATVTVNGHTYTLHVDMQTLNVTVS